MARPIRKNLKLPNKVPRLRYKSLKYKLLQNSYNWNMAHIPSALSQLRYLKDLIPLLIYKYPEYQWVAGKQFGQQAYYTIYQTLGLNHLVPKDYNDIIPPTRPILLNNINKEFKYVEETLGNSLGVAIGMAMSQIRPIWVNISDSTFLMGRTLEALKIIKKFNLNIFITVDCNKYTRASKDKNLDIEIYKVCEAYRLEVFSTCANYPNNFTDEFEKVLKLTTPRIMIINTIKGDGFKEFEEDPIGWHYRKLTEKDYERICRAKDNPSTYEHEHLIEYIN